MNNKICMVTGANSGIGFATASELARRGATVIMVCRDRQKGLEAQRQIRQAYGNDRVRLLLADLSLGASIRKAIEEFRNEHSKLHVLVNNAGGYFTDRYETSEGLELTFAVNHMGYFRLTTGLLDVLKASAPSRIVNVASDAHRMAPFDFTDPQSATKKYRGHRAYAQSKLANILFTRELSDRLAETGVTANAVHPGMVNTSFARSNRKTVGNVAYRLLTSVFSIDAVKGAATSVYLATSPDVEKVSGAYFARSRPSEPSAAALDPEAARRLWDLSMQLEQRDSHPANPAQTTD